MHLDQNDKNHCIAVLVSMIGRALSGDPHFNTVLFGYGSDFRYIFTVDDQVVFATTEGYRQPEGVKTVVCKYERYPKNLPRLTEYLAKRVIESCRNSFMNQALVGFPDSTQRHEGAGRLLDRQISIIGDETFVDFPKKETATGG